jgi:hypothetical protein
VRHVWTKEDLERAISAIDNRVPMLTTTKNANIPLSTFRSHLYGKTVSRKRGPETVLTMDEENQIKNYVLQMQELGHPLSLLQLRLLVARITQTRYTPFRDGIPGKGWMKWFCRRHPDLTLRKPQGLESARARGLCLEAVQSFYKNLGELYEKHNYESSHVWNCDETRVQAGCQARTHVLAKKGSRTVYSVLPDEREWMSILTCINAARQSIPSFYIFRGKRFLRNYIKNCEDGAAMAMQPKAWMTGFLFYC